MTILDDGPVLVLGASGQLGGELRRALTARGAAHRLAARRPGSDWLHADLLDPHPVAALVTELAPSVVVNASAYTAVDRAESEPDVAMAVNAVAPAVIARACRDSGALLVHFSTDYVFDGENEGRYTESDQPAPLNRYGLSKLRGEQAVAGSGAAHLILRTSWLYTPGGRNFVTTMLRLFSGDAPVRVVADQRGCPTWARPLAEAVVDLLMQHDAHALRALSGLYHLCSAGDASWFEFARAIHQQARPPARAPLEATDTAGFGAPAARPRRAVLDCGRAARALGIALAHWRDQLAAAMPEFNAAAPSNA